MLGNSGTPDNPYAYTNRDLINTAVGIIRGDYGYGTRPVSDAEILLVNGIGAPPKPTKKFFDVGYKVGQTVKDIMTPATTNPLQGTETFLNLLKKAANKLASLDADKVGQTLGRYADATGSQGGFKKASQKK